MSQLRLDPQPAAKLDWLWDNLPRAAEAIEDILDWIEADPVDVRAKRHRFSVGIWAVTRSAAGREWLVLWDEAADGTRFIRYLDESSAL